MLQPDDGVPPIEPGPYLVEEPLTKWPRVIGIISLCYAILGLLCGLSYGASGFLSEYFMRIARMSVTMPPTMKVMALVSALIMLSLGILMLTGSVGLLRRRRSGVVFLKRWALLRVVFAVIGLVLAVLTAPVVIQFNKDVEAQQIKMFEEAGRTDAKPKSDEQHWFQHMVGTGVATVLIMAYPVFLGFYLSRRKVTEEVQNWR